MSRTFSRYASGAVKRQLSNLLEARHDVAGYRGAMTALGRSLGEVIARLVPGGERVMVACSVEDADYLARGLVDVLEEHVGARRLRLACFWNGRTTVGRKVPVEQAPILRQYVEPHGKTVPHLIMVKSIISTSCVVRTNLLQLLDQVQPRHIFIAAPVMHREAPANLEREFPERIVAKFNYVYFAKDDVLDANRMIVPGIGGSVYERLGLGTQEQKNRLSPTLVVERRRTVERERLGVTA